MIIVAPGTKLVQHSKPINVMDPVFQSKLNGKHGYKVIDKEEKGFENLFQMILKLMLKMLLMLNKIYHLFIPQCSTYLSLA